MVVLYSTDKGTRQENEDKETGLLGFLDFVHRLIGYKNIKKHDVSEAGSAPVLM
jgi:hypothetical protein